MGKLNSPLPKVDWEQGLSAVVVELWKSYSEPAGST